MLLPSRDGAVDCYHFCNSDINHELKQPILLSIAVYKGGSEFLT